MERRLERLESQTRRQRLLLLAVMTVSLVSLVKAVVGSGPVPVVLKAPVKIVAPDGRTLMQVDTLGQRTQFLLFGPSGEARVGLSVSATIAMLGLSGPEDKTVAYVSADASGGSIGLSNAASDSMVVLQALKKHGGVVAVYDARGEASGSLPADYPQYPPRAR